jgi:hypothetical protein
MKLEDIFSDPEKKAKLLRLFWIISLGMLVLGYLMILIFWNRT